MTVVVARIGKPHSLRGEVTVQLHTDNPTGRFVPGTVFGTEAPVGSRVPKELTLRTARLHNGVWLLSFDGVPDRAGAEGLRGARLVLESGPRPALPPEADDDEAYHEDELVGLVAETVDGERLGTVTGLETGPAQDLLVLTLEDGASAWVPFVTPIVPEVDVAAGRVVIDPPPGLLDLNRGI